jgi:FkbM family methyltransferase
MPKTSQGYKPNIARRILRTLARLLLRLFRIDGQSLWGNVVVQQFQPIIKICNPFDSNQELEFFAGHERLYWRVIETSKLDYLYKNFLENLDSKSVLYDIGANIGMTCIAPAQYFGCTVIAFEPEPLNFANLHKNVMQNNLEDKIFYFPFALNEKNVLEDFFIKSVTPGDALHSIKFPSAQIAEQNVSSVKSYKVFTLSLDHLNKIYRLPNPSHVKIDVDGCELSVLKGMTNILRSQATNKVFIEVNINQKQGDFLKISQFLLSFGFRLMKISDPENDYSREIRNCLFSRG